MKRCVIAFFVLPFFGFSQCPIKQDSLTDRFGNTWKGTISDQAVWPTILIDQPGRGRYGANINDVIDYKWEGVTNAMQCYFVPGMAAYNNGRTLFEKAAAIDDPKRQQQLRAQSQAEIRRAIDLLANIKPAASRVRPNLFEDAQKHIKAARKMLPKAKPVPANAP